MNPLVRVAGAAAERVLREPRGLTVAGWHRVDALPGGLSTSVDEFRRHLDVLDEWHVVALDEGLRAPAPRSVALTFDDGYASVGEVAWPLLRERGWPATLYVVTGFLDGGRFPWDATVSAPLLSAAAVRDLHADGLAIGSHTVTHRWLPHLAAADVRREVLDSKSALEDVLGAPVESFAYPMGGWSAPVVNAVRAAAYANAVTVDRGTQPQSRDPLLVRRSFAPRGAADFRRTLRGAYSFLRPVDRWRTRNGPVF